MKARVSAINRKRILKAMQNISNKLCVEIIGSGSASSICKC